MSLPDAGKCQSVFIKPVEPLFLHPILQLNDSFVHIPPHNDRRMVVMLTDHSRKALVAFVRNSSPKAIKSTTGISSHTSMPSSCKHATRHHPAGNVPSGQSLHHIFQQLHIPAMHFIRKRYPHRHLVLMATSSYQLHWFPIQFEAFLRIHAEPADPQGTRISSFNTLPRSSFKETFTLYR